MNFRLIFTLFSMWIFTTVIMADDFWHERAKGWHWYEDPHEYKTNIPKESASFDAVQVMESLHQQIKQSLYQAILNPTPDNMHHYIALQNQVSDQAQRFSAAWQTALLNNPNLDYSISHPTNAIGSQIYASSQIENEDQAIFLLAKHSGLFFFYRSSCPYCQRFAPILKSFSARYGISVVPITTDGVALPSFPDSHPDQGQAARFKVTLEPALFTVDPYSHEIIPVGYGLMSEDELKDRILTIARRSKDTEPYP